MFTGIVEATTHVVEINQVGSNIHFTLNNPFTEPFKIDQSVAHNGVCLTVVAVKDNSYTVTAVAETLAKTNLGFWRVGDIINLERSLRAGDRIDGHFVQGHVDNIAICLEKQTLDGSWLFKFQYPVKYAALIIDKGSVCLNGVSLTAFNPGKDYFYVTIIPYTFQHTNFNTVKEGDLLNIEFDILGKYILRSKDVEQA